MNSVPPEFHARIAEHNRSCWIAAALSLLGGWLLWLLFGALATGGVLVFETVRTGNVNLENWPAWFVPAGLAAVVVLLVGTAVERAKTRYRPPTDRPIIGWHLVPQVLMLPAQLTFAIWDHLGARIRLSKSGRAEAWRLLQTIAETGRAQREYLTAEFPDDRMLGRLLLALQLTGWIDLHRGEDLWFYRVRSDEEEELRRLMREPEEGEE